MGTLANGYVYTGQVAQKEVEINCSTAHECYIKIAYTEYFNLINNTSCLQIDKLYYKGRNGQYLAPSNTVMSGGGSAETTTINSTYYGIRFDGQQMVDAGNAPVIFNYWGQATHIVNIPTPLTYKEIAKQRPTAQSYPYYTQVITHNTDGSRSLPISISFSCYFQIYSNYNTTEILQGSIVLPLYTIPRASSFTVGNATVDSSSTITISKQINSAIHTITATYADGFIQTIATQTSATSLTFTPNATHAYASMGSTASATNVTFNCITYNNGVMIGSSSQVISVYANMADCKPQVEIACSVLNDQPALTGEANKIILNYSNVKVQLSITYKNGAAASSVYIQNGSTKVEATTATFNTVTSNQFIVYVKDSRGIENQITFAPAAINYSKPTVTVTAAPPDTLTNISTCEAKGNFFNDTFGAVTNTLTVSVLFYDTTTSTGDSDTPTVTKNNNTYSAAASFTGDYRHSYYYKVTVTDKLNTVESAEYYVRTLPLFDWDNNYFNFNIPVQIEGEELVNKNNLLDFVYPVGSIYMSVNNVSPNSFLGGTWEALESRFLLGASSAYPAGSTGGEATHTLTIAEMPSHNHTSAGLPQNQSPTWKDGYTRTAYAVTAENPYPSNVPTNYNGGGAAHNNMPPYLSVYMWKRTA